MKLGTVSYDGKIYNLDNIRIDEVRSLMDKMNYSKNQVIKKVEDTVDKMDNNVYTMLMNSFSEAESSIKNSALVNRAYYSRITNEIVDEKINNEMKAIKTSIQAIYPRLKEGTKNYIKIRDLVSVGMVDYEKNLSELGHYYDNKIERLILDKVETESCLCYSILSKRYFFDKATLRDNMKKNDRAKLSIKETIVGFVDRFSKNKEEKRSIDPLMMTKLMDSKEIVEDFNSINDIEYNRVIENSRINEEDIKTFKKKIKEIEKDIDKLNEEKKSKIISAMEEGGKEISKDIKKPKTFSRITKFFAIKFNLYGYIQNNVICKLNDRVSQYRNDILSKITDDSIGE